ncbi:LysR substrate-binding domain-containing protein [Hoeflea prorocentri]|uniref:LysR substrate-binding domain-containing protein n=1 Tax=Hoeflea prorocentri TaxID=1922333 RepID=A0A9X3UMF0_9HYPH|nr:LysR substrate-binding domain-containing protein [Hoeflea prorocentri]MCY6383090.1 LysR substrate-binding domain-containing protein [Hoeflea prorocentri]MDA5400890.1 LysR substrate-binding domain-containing protein [Hoeflea prorocentri]
MDLVALESFVAVCETLNFSEAARRRNTVQSAISSHITKLEELVGQTLFERGRGKRVRLTDEGTVFLAYARRILALTDEAVDTMRSSGAQTTIRLGTTVTLALSVLPVALRAFARSYPDVQIHISCDRSDALAGRFDAGELDLAFMMDQGRRSGRVFVEDSPLVWAAGEHFDGNFGQDVPLVFLTDGRDLRRFALEALDRIGRRGFIAHTSPDPVGVRSFVAAGVALTVMPKVAVLPPLRIVAEDEGLPSLNSVALSLYRQSDGHRPDISALETILQNSVRSRP